MGKGVGLWPSVRAIARSNLSTGRAGVSERQGPKEFTKAYIAKNSNLDLGSLSPDPGLEPVGKGVALWPAVEAIAR